MEYTSSNSANSRGSCSYNNLGTYTSGYSMNVAPTGKPPTGSYIVPVWGSISYDSLSGSGTCSGYGTIISGYGNGAGSCQTQYTTSMCGSNTGSQAKRM